jgi:hypothetical protein
LDEFAEVFLLAPVAVEVVEPAGERVDDHGILPLRQLDEQPSGLAAKELGGAVHRFIQPQPPAGGTDGTRIVNLRFHGNDMRQGSPPFCVDDGLLVFDKWLLRDQLEAEGWLAVGVSSVCSRVVMAFNSHLPVRLT